MLRLRGTVEETGLRLSEPDLTQITADHRGDLARPDDQQDPVAGRQSASTERRWFLGSANSTPGLGGRFRAALLLSSPNPGAGRKFLDHETE